MASHTGSNSASNGDGAHIQEPEGASMEEDKPRLLKGRSPLYQAPIQTRKWGQPEGHHPPPWGSAFFDLIYVAAAYRIGTLYGAHLHQGENALEGLLYFLAIFGHYVSAWFIKLMMDGRYHTVDVFHQLLTFVEFIFISCAVYFIPYEAIHLGGLGAHRRLASYSYSSYSSYSYYGSGTDDRLETTPSEAFSEYKIHTLGMQISLGLYYMSRTFRMVELLFDKNQSLASRNFAKLCIVMQAPLLISLLIPTIMIAIDTETTKSAVWFWLTGPLGFIFSFLFTVVFYLEWIKNRGLKITDYTVPISITSFIHRIGEFITLMLGETVLSLVLVVEGYKGNVDGYMNVATFCTCLLTATLLHFHHFASYPDHAEDHIARKSKNKGAKFMVLCLYGYSSSLMAFGVSSKYILKHTIYESKSRVVNLTYCVSLVCCFVVIQWMHSYHRGGPGLYFRVLLEDAKHLVRYLRDISGKHDEVFTDVVTIAIFLAKVLSVALLLWLGNIDNLKPSSCAFYVLGIVVFQTLIIALELPFERAQVAQVKDAGFYEEAEEAGFFRVRVRSFTSDRARDSISKDPLPGIEEGGEGGGGVELAQVDSSAL